MHRMLLSLLAIVGLSIAAVGPGTNLSEVKASEIRPSKVTWFLANVTPFASGQTATGFFTVDQENGTVVDWNITVTGGSKPALTNLQFDTNTIGCVAFCVSPIEELTVGSGTIIQFRTPLASDNTIEEFTLGIFATPNEIIFPNSPELMVGNRGMVNTVIDKALFNSLDDTLALIDRDDLSPAANATLVLFAGTPGKPNCHGQTVSRLAQEFGGINAAASALGYPAVRALKNAITEFCKG